MDPLYTFPASHTTDSVTLWLGLLALVVGGLASYFFLRMQGSRENYNMRMIGAMLCFFVALLGAGTAVFSYLSMGRMSTINIYTDRLETGYGTVSLKDIRQLKFEKGGRSSLIDPGQINNEKRMLVITERSGKAHVLPEEIYDVNGIMQALQEVGERRSK